MKALALAALLTLSGCALQLPRECEPGFWPEKISRDSGTDYVCVPTDD